MIRYFIHKTAIISLLALLALGATGCNDFLDVEPKHEASEEHQWQTLEDTRSALMGIYGLMRTALIDNNTLWAVGDLRAGDFTVTSRRDLQAIADNNLNLNIRLIDEIADWNRFYAVINAANVFIERAPGILGQDKAYSEENLKYDLAQARALRALAYFEIARIWGDAPLVTISYDNGSFPDIPQSQQSEILEYVKQELISVANILPFKFGSSNSQYYRQNADYWHGKLMNKVSVYALLAHVSAMQSRYSDVETYTSFVLSNQTNIGVSAANEYITVANLVSPTGYFCGSTTTFAANRYLSFNFMHANNETTATGHLEEWTLAKPYTSKSVPEIYLSRDTLMSMFDDTNDLRFHFDPEGEKYSTDGFIDMNSQFPIFKKVNVIQDGASKDGDYAVFGSSVSLTRNEDMALLRAEALAVLNKSSESLILLNTLRAQRGLAALSMKNDLDNRKDRLIDEIFKERRREFVGEGIAWYDLIRRQKLLNDDRDMQALIDNGGIYWPVSTKVLENNPLINQNSYWSGK